MVTIAGHASLARERGLSGQLPRARCLRSWRLRQRLCMVAASSIALLFVLLPGLVVSCFTPIAPASGASRYALRGQNKRAARQGSERIAASALLSNLQARATLGLIKEQNKAGFDLKDLGLRLHEAAFEATALDGKALVVVDGFQDVKKIEVQPGAVDAAGGNEALAGALLAAMQEAHDSSYAATRGDVWNLYKTETSLIQAPLGQIGVGNTAEDLWKNVEKTDETIRLAEELFAKFDVDGDGWWNQNETSTVQLATEGTEMPEDAFQALLIAAAPDGGRNLSEEDLVKGLSKAQVIELYTDAARQRALGFVLDIRKDHAKVFKSEEEKAAEAAAKAPIAVD